MTAIKDDGQRAAGARALYAATPAALHDSVVPPVLEILKPVLFANTAADSGLLPFYAGIERDPALTPRNRATASLHLAAFWAYIARDADSARAALLRMRVHWASLTGRQQASWTGAAAQYALLNGDIQGAIDNFYRALLQYEKLGDTAAAVKVSVNLANVYRSISDYRHAASLRRTAIGYLSTRADSATLLVALQGLGADYAELSDYDSARYFLNQAESRLDAGLYNATVAFYTYATKAGMYITLHRPDSARFYLEKARPLLAVQQDEAAALLFQLNNIVVSANTENVQADARELEQLGDEAIRAGDLQTAQKCYFSLWNAAVVQPLQQTALDYHLVYDSLTAVLAQTANRRYAAEMAARYESEKKNLTIQLQGKAIRQRNTTVGLLAALLITAALATGIAVLRWRLLRARRDARRHQNFTRELLRHTEAERSRIAGHLHDGLSHDLLHLKRSLGEGKEATAARIDGLINDVRAISRDLHPVVLGQIGLAHSIQNLCEKTMADGDLFVSADIDYKATLSADCELQIFRIVQESLTNIVRHAAAVAAKVTLTTRNDQLELCIQDNGRGFDVNAALSGGMAFGLLGIMARGEALDGVTAIQSNMSGTIIRLDIKLHHGHAAAC